MPNQEDQSCPCGSQKALADCCGPYIQSQSAPTAEALMRSRYTAYCLGQIDYLIATHHPLHRAPDSYRQIADTIRRSTWLGLRVLDTQQGQPEDKTGVVEFVAAYRDGKRTAQIHERSRFRQQRGRWLYLEGDLLPPLRPKGSEPCWCGSGKPFKRCHGR